MLPVAVDLHDELISGAYGVAIPGLQCSSVTHVERMANHRRACLESSCHGVVVGAVVDHENVETGADPK